MAASDSTIEDLFHSVFTDDYYYICVLYGAECCQQYEEIRRKTGPSAPLDLIKAELACRHAPHFYERVATLALQRPITIKALHRKTTTPARERRLIAKQWDTLLEKGETSLKRIKALNADYIQRICRDVVTQQPWVTDFVTQFAAKDPVQNHHGFLFSVKNDLKNPSYWYEKFSESECAEYGSNTVLQTCQKLADIAVADDILTNTANEERAENVLEQKYQPGTTAKQFHEISTEKMRAVQRPLRIGKTAACTNDMAKDALNPVDASSHTANMRPYVIASTPAHNAPNDMYDWLDSYSPVYVADTQDVSDDITLLEEVLQLIENKRPAEEPSSEFPIAIDHRQHDPLRSAQRMLWKHIDDNS